MNRTTWSGGAAAVMLAALLVAAPTGGAAHASCAGPYIDADPPGTTEPSARPTVEPGGRITLYGHWYTSTCNDTGGNDPLVPLPPVHVTVLLPGGGTLDVGTFTPHGESMGFTAVATIPAITPSGIATVLDGSDVGLEYRFAIDPSGVADATIAPPSEPPAWRSWLILTALLVVACVPAARAHA